MKKKLEKKQLPAVVALAVVSVGALGYTGYQLLSGGSQPAPAAAHTPGEPYGPETAVSGTRAGAPNGATDPKKPLAQLTTLPPSFRPDPFRPAIRPPGATGSVPPRGAQPGNAPAPVMAKLPPVPEPVDMNAPSLPPGGEWTPRALQGQFSGGEPGLGAAPAMPPAGAPGAAPAGSAAALPMPPPRHAAPERPALILTGVIQGEPSVAILRGNQEERHVVRVNDRVAGRYVVKSIHADGVFLAAVAGPQPDRWFLPLGGEK